MSSRSNTPNLSPIIENDSVTSKSTIRITPLTKAQKLNANDYERKNLSEVNEESSDEDKIGRKKPKQRSPQSSPELPDLRTEKKAVKALAEEFLDDEAESRYSSSYGAVDDESQESTTRNLNESIVTLSSDEEGKDENDDQKNLKKYRRIMDRLLEDD